VKSNASWEIGVPPVRFERLAPFPAVMLTSFATGGVPVISYWRR
jgi:hypothetical protein